MLFCFKFVLNSYGVAVYLTSYLMKSHALMNRVLRVAAVELRNNRNMPLKQKRVQVSELFGDIGTRMRLSFAKYAGFVLIS